TKIDGLERRFKKIEKKHKSRTHKLKRLYKFGLTARVISSSDNETLNKEDTSKQVRIDEIDADEDIALVSRHDDNVVQDEGIEDVGEEEVVEAVTTAKMIIDAAQVTTAIADIPVSAAETIVTTALTITAESITTNVEVTQAPKRKGRKEENSFLQKRDEENRNKPPTKAQQRGIMSTCLKNMDGWNPRALKKKSFAKIQELFDNAMKRKNNFVDFRTELVEENDGDDVTIDATPLSSKSPTIVHYKNYKEGKKNYF
nr:hypothetical protein [Tanacetum cinerariifolium]